AVSVARPKTERSSSGGFNRGGGGFNRGGGGGYNKRRY
ncbi:MAG: RNA-binding protein, partial [Bacteroidetes bacterium]|nr:RNA-binding protein [Bacteroidota bacterium]